MPDDWEHIGDVAKRVASGIDYKPDPDAERNPVGYGEGSRHLSNRTDEHGHDSRMELALTLHLAKAREGKRKAMRSTAVYQGKRNGAVQRYGNPFNLQEVADKVGVAKMTLHRWETGHHRPKCMILWVRWCAALDLSFPQLLSEVIGELNGYAVSIRPYLGIVLDADRNTVVRKGESVALTGQQFKMLAVLVKAKGRVLSYDAVLHAMYGGWGDDVPQMGTLKVMKTHINRKIHHLGILMETQWGEGIFVSQIKSPKKAAS